MRNTSSSYNSDSSFVRDLRRLLARLTAVSDGESLVSLLTDYYRFSRFASGQQGSASTQKPDLTPQLWFLAECILRITEGTNRTETLTRCARLLGSLLLVVPSSGRRWRELQFGYKLLYRAALSLRLLDHALEHKLLQELQLQQYFEQRSYGDDNCPYRLNVQLPLVIAVMLTDAGQLEPDAMTLLLGYTGDLDTTRALSPDERTEYLKRSQQATNQLVSTALDILPYKGNSKGEKQQHQQLELARLALIRQFCQLQAEPGSMLGNILKIPQVYSSMVLPGRQRYSYDALPKASLLLKDSVVRGQLNGLLVQHFLRITGIFPQGFGIAFTPARQDNNLPEKYELAIVNQLYPAKMSEPLCRIVSRNLQYRRSGQNCTISMEHNLYFKPARQRLAIIPPERLQAILTKLSADWQPGQLRRNIPRCWQPEQFFEKPEHQNLWNSATVRQN